MSGAARWFCPSASRRLRDCLVIESDDGRVAHPRRGEGGVSMMTEEYRRSLLRAMSFAGCALGAGDSS